MMKLHFMIIFTLITLLFFPFPVVAQSINIPGDIPYILIDSKTGQVLAEQNADQVLRPASTTKIMTAVVALENGKLDQNMTVSQNAVYDIGKGGMNVGIMAGEEGLTLDHMLHLMLIKSANETANIIAENVAPSRSEFIDMMNKKAKELGAVNTHFVNPSGKDTEAVDADHLTTPRDLAVMARYAMTIPKFREIVATEYYKEMPVTNKHDDWGILRNSNQFLWHDNTYSYTLDGSEHRFTVIGVKTGYTAAAGNNLVTAAVGEDGMELISVVMHVTQPNKIYGYAKELLRYGFQNYAMQKISEAGDLATTVIVEEAKEQGAMLELVTESEFTAILPAGTNRDSIVTKVVADHTITAPVNKGDILGEVQYYKQNELLGKVNVVAARTVEAAPVGAAGDAKGTKDTESAFSYVLYGILLFLSGLVILRMVLRRISRKVKKKKYAQNDTD